MPTAYCLLLFYRPLLRCYRLDFVLTQLASHLLFVYFILKPDHYALHNSRLTNESPPFLITSDVSGPINHS